MSFLTVEDINTTIFNNADFYWDSIDTSKISANENYEDIKYDFTIVSKQTNTSQSHSYDYEYAFDVRADNWTYGFYIDANSGNEYDSEYDEETGILYVWIDDPYFIIYLYMGGLKIPLTNRLELYYELVDNILNLNYKELHTAQEVQFVMRGSTEVETIEKSLNRGYNLITYNNSTIGYLRVNLIKTDFKFDCNQELTVGKVNKVQLGTHFDYKPNGSLIGDNTPKITVTYNKQTIPVIWDSELDDYVFELDLSEKRNSSNIRFKVHIESNKVINSTDTTVVLHSSYETVSTFEDFASACNTGGIEIIFVDSDITFTSNISVAHNMKIIGTHTSFNLNNHSINLNEGITFDAEKLSFDSGDPAIIQVQNTILNLTDCIFNNCTSTNYNDLGSCIFCDVDFENLSDPSDYETNLISCTFTNNQSCILHGGQLTINECKYHNTDIDYVNIHNVAFLYQLDGDASINNSIFDIDYTSNELCANEINIGFAQAIIKCGETATINGATYIDLGADNTLPLFNQVNRNQSHLFAKYYYPKAETCVYSSPNENKEDVCCCHTVSGVDWVFKNNIQVTRADWNSQNENRKIIWGE